MGVPVAPFHLQLEERVLVDGHVDSLVVTAYGLFTPTFANVVNGLCAVHIPEDAKGLAR